MLVRHSSALLTSPGCAACHAGSRTAPARQISPVGVPWVPERRRCVAARAGDPKDVEVINNAKSAASQDAAPGPWKAGPRDWDLQLADAWKWEQTGDAVGAYGALALTLALGESGWLSRLGPAGDLPYFMALAACTIYIGAHRGLTSKTRQTLSLGQGAAAPLLASVSLFGAYLLIKYLPNFDLQTILNAYFWLLGSVSVAGALPGPLGVLGGALGQKSIDVKVPEGLLLDEEGEVVTEGKVAPTDILAVVIGVGAASADLACGHSNFTLNNLIACLVAADILQLIGLKSFRAAGVLLLGMLVYDVFWVFGSAPVVGDNVMVTVATSEALTGPVKLLFPRPGAIPGDFPWQILGLGDVAIPGLLACLALRYDASRTPDMRSRARAAGDAITHTTAKLPEGISDRDASVALGDAALDAYEEVAGLEDRFNAGEEEREGEKFPGVPREVLSNRQYFAAVMGAYLAGLVVAFGANAVTKLGQPALLYLVPATVGAVIVTADSRNEFQRVWDFTDKTRTPQEVFEAAERRRRERKGEATSQEDKGGQGRANSPDWWPFK